MTSNNIKEIMIMNNMGYDDSNFCNLMKYCIIPFYNFQSFVGNYCKEKEDMDTFLFNNYKTIHRLYRWQKQKDIYMRKISQIIEAQEVPYEIWKELLYYIEDKELKTIDLFAKAHKIDEKSKKDFAIYMINYYVKKYSIMKNVDVEDAYDQVKDIFEKEDLI